MSDLSELLALGVSHKTAPVEVRERLALLDGSSEAFLRELLGDAEIHEAVAISTCNRTELYLVVGDAVEAESTALGMLSRRAGIRPTELADSIYSLRNCDAARHLYRVTAGLESMIVGEHEVQGQVKRAYEQARQAEFTGAMTNRMFRAALATGKRVREETGISAGRTSLSSAAVDFARESVGELAGKRVVILGTGETSELTAAALAAQGAEGVFVANRRHDRALELARRYGGRTVGFDELPGELESADIVLASTSSPHPLITQDELELVMLARSDRPLLLIDLAVPRDIDSACADIPGVTLRDVDDLHGVLARTQSVRAAEARSAEAIVEAEIQSFARWLGSLEVLPTITALREHGRTIVEGVLEENDGRWESLSDRDRDRLEAVARTVMQRLLHEPTLRMKRAGEERTHARMQLLRELFGLEEPASAPEAEADGADVAPEPADAEVRELRSRRGA
jgi:glutamyl-tRNA reductase